MFKKYQKILNEIKDITYIFKSIITNFYLVFLKIGENIKKRS